jgi:hypothetical protein
MSTIQRYRAEGLSFARIAAHSNANGVPTSHGGTRWWPSTERFVLTRSIDDTPEHQPSTTEHNRIRKAVT